MAAENSNYKELLFNGAENFPREYHDNEFYKKEVDEEKKKLIDYLNSIAPDFLDQSGLIPKSREE